MNPNKYMPNHTSGNLEHQFGLNTTTMNQIRQSKNGAIDLSRTRPAGLNNTSILEAQKYSTTSQAGQIIIKGNR